MICVIAYHMHYFGGKFRTWKQITSYLESIRDGRDYIEPFVGGAWVVQGMSGKRLAYDANQALIVLYQSLQNGWIPPDIVTEDDYLEIKSALNPNDPMTAFVGFGCSYSGKWFGGYARDSTGRNYARNAKNSLLRKLNTIQDVSFETADFISIPNPKNSLIYCDPPYRNTTQYDGVGRFDHDAFWKTVRHWSRDNIVVISEYEAPDDFECVVSITTKTDIRTKLGKQARIEKLFRLR